MKRAELETIIDFIAVAVVLIFVGIWTYTEFLRTPPYVDPERYPIRGIDVSAHNGMLNFKAVAEDGYSFVFLKASEGGDFRDENFTLNYDKARDAGLAVGAYHFFRFDTDGIVQAKNLIGAIDNRKLDLGIAIDVEETGNPRGVSDELITDRLGRMIELLNLHGYRVILYSNRNDYYGYLQRDFQGLPLWICSFNQIPISTEWLFWQFNHRGRVKGAKGDTDINVFSGNRTDWDLFLTTGIAPDSKQ